MRTGNSDHQDWQATPYQSDPPAIEEAAKKESKGRNFVLAVIFGVVLSAAIGVGFVLVIWKAFHS